MYFDCADYPPISASEKMVEAFLREADAREVRFSRYAEAAHDSWTRAYGDVEVWRWMLGRRRGDGGKEVGEVEGVVVPEGNKVRVV